MFDNEIDEMTEVAIDSLIDEDSYYTTEHPYARWRTDLVECWIEEGRLDRRERSVGHLIPLPDERKYRVSHQRIRLIGPLTRQDWMDDSEYAEGTSRKVWHYFEGNRWLQPEGAGRFTVAPIPDHIKVTAYELKQGDWRQALRQAARAEHYAERRVVVMDADDTGGAEDHRGEFRDEGVGLYFLHEDGTVDKKIHPKWIQPADSRSRLMLNERSLHGIDPDDYR